jgi:glycosyltransferase involved in cell wall biosynthesis
MVLTEALLLKTPVVTTDFPAAWEFVSPNKNGIIVEQDWQKIFAMLEKLLKNPVEIQKLQNNMLKENLDIKSVFWSDFKKLLSL